MRLFSFLRSRKQGSLDSDESFEDYAARIISEFKKHDYLGKAAVARSEAKLAVSEGRFDDAWRKYHEEKDHFLNHATRNNFTPEQVSALDGTVSKSFANVLRLEKRHNDAFVHIVYWVASSNSETKEQAQKLIAYFNRCKFKHRDIDDVRALIDQLKPLPDFRMIQEAVSAWE